MSTSHVIWLGLIAGSSLAFFLVLTHSDTVAHRKCDKIVHELLTSKDQTEVIRAGILTIQLNCGVTSRMGAEYE
jgi:hypothetical protein